MKTDRIEENYRDSLKSLMYFRVLFAVLMTGSAFLFQISEHLSNDISTFGFIYGLTGLILFISLIYTIVFQFVTNIRWFAAIQIITDTLTVSVIVCLTGCFSSIFNFLYLVVIIYASFFLLTRGSLLIAFFCSLQYAGLVSLEYFGILIPEDVFDGGMVEPINLSLAAYKVLIMVAACFAVAFLSSLLAEQNRKTKKRLYAMADQVKRVEQMAAVGEMASALAHEIKNPLASLSGAIQLLKEDLQPYPEYKHLMNIALREAHRLGTLVGDFLQFARPKVGKSELILLERSLEEILEIFKKHDDCRDRLNIRCRLVPGLRIRMDRTHFHQIIWNLLINAAEAIEGHGEIVISSKTLAHHCIAIEISDTGCGMSAEQIASIFFPFYTTKTSGTGLGLSIVHRILESYRYTIEVNSEIDHGATFTLLFDSRS